MPKKEVLLPNGINSRNNRMEIKYLNNKTRDDYGYKIK